jgi:prepilin peptidase CpaA
MGMELAQGLALSATSVAALIDVRTRRIPNWLTFGTLAAGVLLNAWLHGFSGAAFAVTGAGLGLVMLLPFFVLRAIGAGDVKLLAAVGALLGAQALVSVAVYGALVGGAMSLVILTMRGRFLALGVFEDVLINCRLPRLSGATAPYGVAIACGVYLSLVLPGVLG